MEYRLLGRTGVRVSSVGLGTMAFGGDADEAAAARIFAAALDAGVNLIDCADVYNAGRAEEVTGRLMRGKRDSLVLATKAYFPTGAGPNDRGASRYHLVRAVEASLRRLRTDRIDLYFLHRADDSTPIDETLRALEDLVRAGKILYPAVSNFAAWETMRALGVAERWGWQRAAVVQPMYNLVKRQAEVELLPMAVAEGLGVITYSPLGGGLLAGGYGVGRRPARGRLVDNPMYATRYGEPGYYGVADRFAAYCAERGLDPVTTAVAWVASHPAVTAPLVGGRSVAQVAPALAAARAPMGAAARREIAALSPAPPPATDRNEEGSGDDYDATLRRAGAK